VGSAKRLIPAVSRLSFVIGAAEGKSEIGGGAEVFPKHLRPNPHG
jgi:hypothetical protein